MLVPLCPCMVSKDKMRGVSGGCKERCCAQFFAGNEGDNQPGRNHRRFKAEWASEKKNEDNQLSMFEDEL